MILAGTRGVRAAAATIVLMMLATPTAFAQSEDAEAAIRQGMDLRKQGQDARALPYFEKAYKLSRTPRTAAQLGLVQMGLGYWVDAERHLGEALSDPDNYWVTKNRAVLDGARTRVRGMIGQLAIIGEPKGAEVLVNGRAMGRLPLGQDVRIGKGPAEIEVRADGYASATRSIVVPGGGREQVSIILEPVLSSGQPPAPAALATPVPGTTVGAPSAGTAGVPATETAPLVDKPGPAVGAGGRPPRALAWGAAGVAVAALAFGGIEAAAMVSKKSEFNDRTIASPTVDDPNRRVSECTTMNLTQACASLRSDYDGAKTLAIVGFVAGGAFAVASGVLFVLTSPGPSGAQAWRDPGRAPAGTGPMFLGCAAIVTSAGVVCSARF